MRFDSLEFAIVFLPAALVLFQLARHAGAELLLPAIIVCSIVFYGWWDINFVPLILASIIVNFCLGKWLIGLAHGEASSRTSAMVLALGVTFNLGLIGWFKYAGFFAETINRLAGTNWSVGKLILPLAISFFTFQQIAFLVDARNRRVTRVALPEYAAFVLFFPQLIAGPIVSFHEMAPQLRRLQEAVRKRIPAKRTDLSVGLAIFAVGLFKKSVMSDTFAPMVDPAFDAAAHGATVNFLVAWGATLSFSFQIYFDFSGYSDMAIGLARMFGLRLPENFNAPYKAPNIIEFWRRWHMTLSRFLRLYLYIPLGGNRKGRERRYVNLMIVMLLGGLWHGAAWTFVIWGALHGVYLVVCHAWGFAKERFGLTRIFSGTVYVWTGRVVTFLAVSVAWVFFRADRPETAFAILGSMFGYEGFSLPSTIMGPIGPLGDLLVALGFSVSEAPLWAGTFQWMAIIISLFFVLACPTTQEIFRRYRPAIGFRDLPAAPKAGFGTVWRSRTALAGLGLMFVYGLFPRKEGSISTMLILVGISVFIAIAAVRFEPRIVWRPTRAYLVVTAMLLVVNFLMMYRGEGGEFIYFQF